MMQLKEYPSATGQHVCTVSASVRVAMRRELMHAGL